jgi:hypothetical protein
MRVALPDFAAAVLQELRPTVVFAFFAELLVEALTKFSVAVSVLLLMELIRLIAILAEILAIPAKNSLE